MLVRYCARPVRPFDARRVKVCTFERVCEREVDCVSERESARVKVSMCERQCVSERDSVCA